MNRTPPVIGKNFTGQREIAFDTRTGDYSESLPLLDDEDLRLQRALLKPAPQPKGETWVFQTKLVEVL